MSIVTKRVVAGLQAAGFVLVTLLAWRVFATLASNIVSCVPWGEKVGCSSPFVGHPWVDSGVRISLLLVSLLAAIWVGNRCFYAPDTYTPAPEQSGSTGLEKKTGDTTADGKRVGSEFAPAVGE